MSLTAFNWTVVGIGKLGKALLAQFEKQEISVGIFHPNIEKAKACSAQYPLHPVVRAEELESSDGLILALPAKQIGPFVETLHTPFQRTVFINMATASHTSDLKGQYPHVKWMGMKFVGQADDLRINGNGLFVTEQTSGENGEDTAAIDLFSSIGRVITDSEASVESVNRIATFHAIKAAKEIEKALQQAGHASEYEKRVLLSLVPGVVRSYAHETLGHFAKAIADELDEKQVGSE
jgi:pyrroline-5-carboxylate reductase